MNAVLGIKACPPDSALYNALSTLPKQCYVEIGLWHPEAEPLTCMYPLASDKGRTWSSLEGILNGKPARLVRRGTGEGEDGGAAQGGARAMEEGEAAPDPRLGSKGKEPHPGSGSGSKESGIGKKEGGSSGEGLVKPESQQAPMDGEAASSDRTSSGEDMETGMSLLHFTERRDRNVA